MIFRLNPIVAVLPMLCALPLSAQSVSPSNQAAVSEALPTVVVTGSREPMPLKDVPQRIDVISAETIQQTPSNQLVDVLNKNSGVDILTYPGMNSAVGIRGFSPSNVMVGSSPKTLILMDGLPVYAGYNVANLPSSGLERIEVLKGPASSLYGAQAMAGVINLIPKRSTEALHGNVEASVGNFNARALQADVGGAVGSQGLNFDYSGNYQQQGNYKNGRNQTMQHSAYNLQNHDLRLGYDFNANWKADVRGSWFIGRDIQDNGATYWPSPEHKNMRRNAYSAKVSGKTGNHQLTFAVYAGNENSQYWDDTPAVPSSLTFKAKSQWYGAQIRDSWQWSKQANLVVGIDFNSQKDRSLSFYNGNASAYSANSQRRSTALYAQQNFSFNNEATNVYIGGRYDWLTLRTFDTDSFVGTGFKPSAQSYGKFTPSAGIKHSLTPDWAVHGSLGQAFVSPDASQMTGNFVRGGINYVGNPLLKPQTSTTADIGFTWETQRGMLDLTYFHTHVRDMIVRDTWKANGVNYSSYANASQGRMQGLELTGKWVVNPWLAVSAGVTHNFEAQSKTNGVWNRNLLVPRTSARVAADAQYGSWTGRVGVRYTGQYVANDWSSGRGVQVTRPGYTLWDLSAAYQFAKGHSVRFSVDNLFNKYYENVPNYPMQGRQMKLAYRWDF